MMHVPTAPQQTTDIAQETILPAAPDDLLATAGTDSIELTWQDNASDEQGFTIQRSTDQTNWTKLVTTDADETTFVDATIELDKSYCYRVSAFNTAGDSDPTSEACAIVATPAPATGGGGGGGSSTPKGPCPVQCASPKPNRAFPTAEGFGALSQGGRGGRVIHVTTLDDYYQYVGEAVIPGSLRWAVEVETGPRIIVFDVGGTILLKCYLKFVGEQGSYVTIAGQTAPGDGIQLGQYGIDIADGAHDIIVRHVRVRTTMTSFVPPINTDGSFLKKSLLICNWKKEKITSAMTSFLTTARLNGAWTILMAPAIVGG